MEENSNETQEVKNTLTDDAVASSDEPLVSLSPPLTSSATLKEGGEGVVADEEKKAPVCYDYEDGTWYFLNSNGTWEPCKEPPLATRYTFKYIGMNCTYVEIDRECYDSDAESVESNMSLTGDEMEQMFRRSAIQKYHQKDLKKCLGKAQDGTVNVERVRLTGWSPYEWDCEPIKPEEEEVTKSRKRPCEDHMASARQAKKRRAVKEEEEKKRQYKEYLDHEREEAKWYYGEYDYLYEDDDDTDCFLRKKEK